MLQAYTQAAASLNLLRAFSTGGFFRYAPRARWTLGFADGDKAERYREMTIRISDTLDFLTAAGITSDSSRDLATVDFYTSHEALLLEYEEALCPRRFDQRDAGIAGSGHLIWIGDRTRQPDGAHVEFCRGVQNPIGLKCGPSLTADDLKVLLAKLNPDNEPGRLTLIARFGAGQVGDHLPRLVRTVQEEGAMCSGPATRCTATSSSRPRVQDPPVRRHPARSARVFRRAQRRRHDPRRRAFRDDRQGRDRMHRRSARGQRRGSVASATTPPATRA